jgi:hypothetical protein
MQAPSIYRTGNHRWLRRQIRSRHLTALPLAILAWLILVPFSVAETDDMNQQTACHADSSKAIYVSDFDLNSADLKPDKGGITGKGYLVPAPEGVPTLRRKKQDTNTAAGKYVKLMSETLVSNLQKAGFTASRLLPTDPRPTQGLLVTGSFTKLDEGNQMRRALLGFGAGNSKMEVHVSMTDLSCAAVQPQYDTFTQKSGGKSPGGVVAMNPYAGAAGFVAKFGMTKGAPEKMVKKTAGKIATELTRTIKAGASLGTAQSGRDH